MTNELGLRDASDIPFEELPLVFTLDRVEHLIEYGHEDMQIPIDRFIFKVNPVCLRTYPRGEFSILLGCACHSDYLREYEIGQRFEMILKPTEKKYSYELPDSSPLS